jgi:hypothetical protein
LDGSFGLRGGELLHCETGHSLLAVKKRKLGAITDR